ncbi:MAG: nucleotide sugar dehydrogenase [Planctomycetota bacterium]|nr:nucleotide sugar dehydrogenase [Planctomycetota bacterium]
MEFKKVSVLGLGYVGLPTAALLATSGVTVLGYDTNPEVRKKLRSGEAHITEPGLRIVLRAALESSRLQIVDELSNSDAFIIAVPTPVEEKHGDLSFVRSATESIAKVVKKGNLVILESTVTPGTTKNLVGATIERLTGLKAGTDFLLAYCPERILPGKILKEMVENDRIIGGINENSAKAAHDLYSYFVEGKLLLTDCTTAEVVKLAENSFRDANIAFANELSQICETVGVSVWEVIKLANHHPRVKILNPGAGVGGHCISVDPWMLIEVAKKAELMATARKVNDEQPLYVAHQILGILKAHKIKNPVAALFGVTYKADVDDVRNSPTKTVGLNLRENGVKVRFCDPHVSEFCGEKTKRVEDAVKGANIVVFLVAHSAWQNLEPQKIANLVRTKLVYDSTGAENAENWAGFEFYQLGSPKQKI